MVTKAPLIIPPDFTLRPPRPGSSGPQDVQVREQARRALIGAARDQSGAAAARETGAQPDRSRAETLFLRKAGTDKADPQIRSVIRRETSALAEKDPSFTRRLLFWQDDSEEESLVDAEKEAERLREAAEKGQSPAQGEVPVIERKDFDLQARFLIDPTRLIADALPAGARHRVNRQKPPWLQSLAARPVALRRRKAVSGRRGGANRNVVKLDLPAKPATAHRRPASGAKDRPAHRRRTAGRSAAPFPGLPRAGASRRRTLCRACRDTPRSRAAAVTVNPRAGRISSRQITPG